MDYNGLILIKILFHLKKKIQFTFKASSHDDSLERALSEISLEYSSEFSITRYKWNFSETIVNVYSKKLRKK